MKSSKNAVNGFTLVEVIVTLVILAILTAILIPAMTGWIDKSKQRICQSNRASIMRQYRAAEAILYGQGLSSDLNGFLGGEGEYAAYAQDIQGLECPSGGVYSSIDGESIRCSVHDNGLRYNGGTKPNESIQAAYQGFQWNGTRIDSNAPDGENNPKVLAELKKAGVDLTNDGIGYWAVTTESGHRVIWWTDQDVDKLKPGDSVRIIAYNTKTGSYTAGTTYVVKYTSDKTATGAQPVTYNRITGVLGTATMKELPGQTAQTKKDYQQTLTIFQTAQ